ncbi:hypothetical protein ACJMK2_037621 [Sinanodonta woodiana]|uniref:Uncharacterized protein n=1 Tax=Sinanodonta woodiana TaxID=1069815 RepID=A0ABD3WMC2_SINWO
MSQLFFIHIRIKESSTPGMDLPMFLTKVTSLLGGYSSATTCIHRFKVTGEPRIIAIYEVKNILGLERTMSGLSRMGVFDVECIPLLAYEPFANFLGVDDSLTTPSAHQITENQLFWMEFTLEYPGKSIEEFLDTWRREATAALSARVIQGRQIDLFKVVAERKIHVFICCSAEELDKLSFNLPVMKENGANTNIKCHVLQKLDDYTNRINKEHL